MAQGIPQNDLQPGDVLLYHGDGLISKAIRFFDGTEVNHSALYLGEQEVVEAIAQGVVRRGLATSSKGSRWVVCRRLKAGVALQPVVGVGATYAGQGLRYGYEQILLLALLTLTRRVKVTPTLKWLLRGVLDSAAWFLSELAQAATGAAKREPMICSELVYRCFHEANPATDDPWELVINRPPGSALALAAGAAAAGPIHPGSLLDLAASSPRLNAPPPAVAAAPGPLPRPEPADLEAALRAYLEEVREPAAWVGAGAALATSPSAAELLADGEILISMEGFAVALERVRPSAVLVAGPPSTATTLGAAVADFVTPGDLLGTDSLFDLGRID